VTAAVVTVKVALVAPAGTVTLAGTVATLVSPLTRGTTVPPLSAAALKVTVPVEGLPPATVVGLSEREESVGSELGMINRSALCSGLPASWAKMFRLNCSDTGDVEMVKFALVAPAGTVTLEGTVAGAVATIEIWTTVGPVCGPLKVMVPVAGLPPTTLVGLTEILERTGGGGGASTRKIVLNL
jgi:hypothetical protein